MTVHRCHALSCGKSCPPAHLCCRACWALVSPETQREVYRTVKLRGPDCDHTWAAWWRASHRAMYEIAIAQGLDGRENEHGNCWSASTWLERQMETADELERDR